MLLLCLALPLPGLAQELPGLAKPEPSMPPVSNTLIETDESGLPNDEQIETRLEEIYSHLPKLEDVVVEVEDGVVILSGSVHDIEGMDSARQLAERAAGTVIVVNNLTRDRSIRARLSAAWESIVSQYKARPVTAPAAVAEHSFKIL